MKLTVLTDNYTIIDRYYLGEPALCFWLEDGDQKILFDTGYSDVFVKNAEALGIDLSTLTRIAFSHGHNDHTGGLPFLWEKTDLNGIPVTACPGVFAHREYDGLSVGSPVTKEECEAHGLIITETAEPVQLSEHLTFLGEIPRTTSFESAMPIGQVMTPAGMEDDYVADDSALVARCRDGIFIITGCSHSGICNIISYAKSLEAFRDLPVIGVIGGFHLMKNDRQLTETVRFLKEEVSGTLYPCHCVCLYAKHRLMAETDVREVGAGMTLDIA